MDASTFLRWWGFTTVDDDVVRRVMVGRPVWARDLGPALLVDQSPPLRSLTEDEILELDFCRIDRVGNDGWWMRYDVPTLWEYDAEGEVRVMGHHERQPDGSVRSTYFLRGSEFAQIVLLVLVAPLFSLAPLLLLPGWWRVLGLLPVAMLWRVHAELSSMPLRIAATHQRLATCPIPPLAPLPVSDQEWPRTKRARGGWL